MDLMIVPFSIRLNGSLFFVPLCRMRPALLAPESESSQSQSDLQ
jgi:hypothetical protein